MPTKYSREDFREHLAEKHPYLRAGGEASPPVAQRLRTPGFMMLVTLSAIIVVLVLGNSMGNLAEYYGQPEREGLALIVSKEVEQPGTPQENHILHVDILHPTGPPIRRDVPADKTSFDAFEVGQEVPVVYQLNRAGDDARIVTLFLPVLIEGTEAEDIEE